MLPPPNEAGLTLRSRFGSKLALHQQLIPKRVVPVLLRLLRVVLQDGWKGLYWLMQGTCPRSRIHSSSFWVEVDPTGLPAEAGPSPASDGDAPTSFVITSVTWAPSGIWQVKPAEEEPNVKGEDDDLKWSTDAVAGFYHHKFMPRRRGLNVVHRKSEDDYGLLRMLTVETLENLQYLGCHALFQDILRWHFHRLRNYHSTRLFNGWVGEQYHIDGVEMSVKATEV
ncbi:hypothetical protein C8R48DRAFT_672551 [Suillus tomentosus]|nr:hypothetical protein C8R48DRAFT_672551 [Suillus tomentosus]